MQRTGNEFSIVLLQALQTTDDSNLFYTAQQLKYENFSSQKQKDGSINAHQKPNPSSFKKCLSKAWK